MTAFVVALALALALPAASLGKAPSGFRTAEGAYITPTSPNTKVIPLITVGENAGVDGFTFEGIPDGIGIAPVDGQRSQMDVFVAHEQSTVPFRNERDHEDASVSRLRVDFSKPNHPVIVDASVPLGPEEGFIRFCSAFMAGPQHGFDNYTFLLNEESNDVIPVPAGAVYGSDPSVAPNRQAGYAVYLDTETGEFDALASLGRHNHENTVIVPGGWSDLVSLSGDDTFTFPSTEARPNLSQLYMSLSDDADAFLNDDSTLYGFQVTGTPGVVDPDDPFNDANDYFEIQPGDTWSGRFIPIPDDVARGLTDKKPQDALEDWSNENNVFQFIRVEDIAYDLNNPRVVYVADTGNSRLFESETTGRLWRLGSSDPRNANASASNGRIFKLVMNASNPTVVDEFSVLADAADVGFAKPDNIDTSARSLMVQEDNDGAKIWRYDLRKGTWSVVATVNDPEGESSGIVDASAWLGPGWWVLDVQAHGSDQQVFSGPGELPLVKREDGQLLLMRVPGS
ncbi:MAG: PhoX family protein [Chloroflexi bacterium]|nr:PhoX family protein [Chloroflexota bacterium]